MPTPTLVIPQKTLKKADLVLIPRQEYEDLLSIQKRSGENIVVKRTIKVPKKYEKYYDKLDRELTESLRDVAAGNYYGPFETVGDMREFFEARRSVKSGPRK